MKTKKSLGLPREARAKWGQNFLRDKKILKKIADFAQIGKGDTVVEVGPGEGTLTELLLERAGKVIAIEKDESLAKQLREKIKDDRLEIIEGDILKVSKSVFKMPQSQKTPFDTDYKLVGNIPYYITGAIFKKFLENPPAGGQPRSITFVVQKEVADRIMARDGKESILSISIKAYGKPEYGGIIKAGSFYPKPKVNSAIIAIRNINKERFPRSDLEKCPKGQTFEEKFFEILKKGFAHKRKLLASNLGSMSRSVLDTFKICGIPEKARAEDLKVDNWICLAKNLI